MPPLAIHTAIAKQMADELRLPALDGERGNLYLGSTAPDIRVITRWERRRTHFFDVDNFDDDGGVWSFCGRHRPRHAHLLTSGQWIEPRWADSIAPLSRSLGTLDRS